MRYTYRLLPDGPGSYRSGDIELLLGRVYTTDDEVLVGRLRRVPFVRITTDPLATPGPDPAVPRPKYLGAVPPAPMPGPVSNSVVTTAALPVPVPVVVVTTGAAAPQPKDDLAEILGMDDDEIVVDAAVVMGRAASLPLASEPAPEPAPASKPEPKAPAVKRAKVSRRKSI